MSALPQLAVPGADPADLARLIEMISARPERGTIGARRRRRPAPGREVACRITDDIGLPRRVRTGAPREGGVMSADLLLYVDDDASERLWGLFDFHRIVCHWPVAAEYLRLCQRHGFDVNGEYDDWAREQVTGITGPDYEFVAAAGRWVREAVAA